MKNKPVNKQLDEILFKAIESAASYTHKVTAEEADFIQEEAKQSILDLITSEREQAYQQGVSDALFNPSGATPEEIRERNKRIGVNKNISNKSNNIDISDKHINQVDMSVNKQVDRKKIILREINIHVPDEDMPYYSQALDDLIASEKVKELENVMNLSLGEKRFIVKRDWTSTDLAEQLDKMIQARINELRNKNDQ